jgi:hypothetical protein
MSQIATTKDIIIKKNTIQFPLGGPNSKAYAENEHSLSKKNSIPYILQLHPLLCLFIKLK